MSGSLLAASTDWSNGRLLLTVKEVYRRTINLASEDNRRFSLITDEDDFLPRSLLMSELPSLDRGEILDIKVEYASYPFFDPLIEKCPLNTRWAGLWKEWPDFLDINDLEEVALALRRDGIRSISGLGPGATPAGDDYLAGWITAHMQLGRARDRELADLRLWWKPQQTTWLSGWIIQDVLDAKIWRRGKTLLSALSGDKQGSVKKALDAIITWGHTSGLAWLAGLGDGLIKLNA